MKNSSPSSMLYDAWYPPAESYYSEDDPDVVPIRQGDILRPKSIYDGSMDKTWLGCLVIHPSCEIITQKARKIQVCRIRLLQEHGKNQQASIAAGETTDEDGNTRVAMAHTFFLPPVSEDHRFDHPMFADLRDTVLVDKTEITTDRRIAIMTHDARVYFIRRYVYWRQRWMLPIQDVLELEKERIGRDANFSGPRPVWAPYVG